MSDSVQFTVLVARLRCRRCGWRWTPRISDVRRTMKTTYTQEGTMITDDCRPRQGGAMNQTDHLTERRAEP